MMREARGLVRKLATVQGLGEEGESSDSASNWVKKMRDKEKEKKLAEERVGHCYQIMTPSLTLLVALLGIKLNYTCF